MTYLPCLLCFLFLWTSIPSASAADDPVQLTEANLTEWRNGTCTLSYLTCDQFASCQDGFLGNDSYFRCQCPEGASGDGYTDGTGCTLAEFPCHTNDDCHEFATCNTDFICECDTGFIGDGLNYCNDTDECLQHPCQPNAICQNTVGTYRCTCDFNNHYEADGLNCTHRCDNDRDCPPDAMCNVKKRLCTCLTGFEKIGDYCYDINECSQENICESWTVCVNTEGSYKCQCPNGYQEQGKSCVPLPRDCEDIRIKEAKVRDGYFYIDPDFNGSANAFVVYCDFRGSYAVTLLESDKEDPVWAIGDITFDYGTDHYSLQALLEHSAFCYQATRLDCTDQFSYNADFRWTDAYNQTHTTWAGSSTEGMCGCGELGKCEHCYCDGSLGDSRDFGYFVDKSKLPVTSVHLGTAKGGKLTMGWLRCAHRHFDFPPHCESYRRNKKNFNGAYHIDTDGIGPNPPFLVYCDLRTYPHVAMTELQVQLENVTLTSAMTVAVHYLQTLSNVLSVVDIHPFCVQTVEYVCKNSGITGGRVYLNVAGDEHQMTYFPGADGVQDSCGCGATQSCQDPDVRCDCDILDGVQRRDGGHIIDKNDLPVRSLTGGNSATENYFLISHLQCGVYQFGIPPNCEKLRTASDAQPPPYTYFIDPDGPPVPGNRKGNVPPFLAQCIFNDNPAYGITIIHHSDEYWFQINASFSLFYLQVTFAQLVKLKERSTFCTQQVEIQCQKFSLTYSGGLASWQALTDTNYVVSDLLTSCTGGGGCSCDGSAGISQDFGLLTDMNVVPITSMDFSDVIAQMTSVSGSMANISVGPLQCSELFPTCAALAQFVKSKSHLGEVLPETETEIAIDSDGAGNVTAFEVECKWPDDTVVTPSNPKGGVDVPGTSKCFDIVYTDKDGDIITPEQLVLLKDASDNCFQTLKVTCEYAKVYGKVNYTTCDGVTQKGWAGSKGHDSCQCGVTGHCEGGPQYKCHCDLEDDNDRMDGAVIIHKDQLPVCQVCLSLDDIPPEQSQTIPKRRLEYSLSNLNCHAGKGRHVQSSCQAVRLKEKLKKERTEIVYQNERSPIPVACHLNVDPPTGFLEVFPETQVFRNVSGNRTFVFEYYTVNMTTLHELMVANIYCSQRIYFFCLPEEEEVTLNGTDGWRDYDGNLQQHWDKLLDTEVTKSSVCTDFADLCERCGSPKGYVVYHKTQLPITGLTISLSTTTTFVLDNAKCSDLHENCYEIKEDGGQLGLGAAWYAVDPDGAGGVDPMKVKCQFKKWCSITTVVSNYMKGLERAGRRHKYSRTVTYGSIIPQQIQALAEISSFCWQPVSFSCKRSRLINKNTPLLSHYSLSGNRSLSFGTADHVDFVGCACGLVGSCGENRTCRCDTRKWDDLLDEGVVTDKTKLPVTSLNFAYQQPLNAYAIMRAGHVKCSNSICYQFPRTCQDALSRPNRYKYNGVLSKYQESGEYLIQPDPTVCEPFLVYCEMDAENKIGITRAIPKTPKNKVLRPGEVLEVEYNGLTDQQLRCLVKESAHCIQPVSYLCYKAQLLGGGAFWETLQDQRQDTWGGGEDGTCACGKDNLCGGQDSRTQQQARKCNCDVNDDRWRKDSGVLTDKNILPVSTIDVTSLSFFNESRINITIGDLICGQIIPKFDECATGFHDCAERADCVDMDEGYDCVCQVGWRGKTQNRTHNDDLPVANGRECFDDDECSFHVCPEGISDCINTPGSFKCICHDGFRATSPTTCQDIDECRRSTLNNCDENAKCINLYGSFKCQCHSDYRGSGVEGDCYPVGTCVLFGDPHTLTFDKCYLNYQGPSECPVMAVTSDCPNKQEDPLGTFSIYYTPWRKEPQKHGMGQFTWVKSVHITMNGHNIDFLQDRVLIVDGVSYPVGFSEDGVVAFKTRSQLVMKTTRGVEVYWNGDDEAEIYVPESSNNSLCGICGNYNGDTEDDWVVGPACRNASDTNTPPTTDNDIVFGSSWMITSDNEKCQPECEPVVPPKQCVMKEEEARKECRKLYNKGTSYFKACLRKLSNDKIKVYQKSCVFDLCRVEDDVNVVICKYAEMLATECQRNTQVDVSEWREQGFCDTTCPEGRVWRTCAEVNAPQTEGGQSPYRTCLTHRVPDLNFDVNTGCVDSCVCEPPLLEEGEECVPEEKCGCFHNNTYILLNQTVTSVNCNESVICREGGVVENVDVTCGEREHCSLEDNVVGCHCLPGYIRVGDHCDEDPCVDLDCGDTAECIQGQCQCLEGFVGDCNNCTDIDECASDLDSECKEDMHEICVNTVGSYYCKCETGYARIGTICTDEDECALGIDACPAHSQCRNEEGHYACSCCVGYAFDHETKLCEWKGEDTMFFNSSDTNATCCDCNTPECDKPGPVCGSDGLTYANIRALVVQNCLAGTKGVEPMYEGDCETSCSQVQCLRPYATCEVLPSGLAYCSCPTCTTINIHIINLACASNEIFYRSECEFEATMCLLNIIDVVIVTDPATCGPGGGGGGGIGVGDWSDCSSDCGLGTISKTVTVGGKTYDVTAVCYANCAERTCADFTCGKNHECVETVVGAQCVCPHCGTEPTDRVCGQILDDPNPETFGNPCELQRAACLRRTDFFLLEHEPCQREPTECAVMDDFRPRTDSWGCRTAGPVNVRHCKGGCSEFMWPSDCCYKATSTSKLITYFCQDGSYNVDMVDDIVTCACISPEELERRKAMEALP